MWTIVGLRRYCGVIHTVPSNVSAVEESAYVHCFEGTGRRGVARSLTESATG